MKSNSNGLPEGSLSYLDSMAKKTGSDEEPSAKIIDPARSLLARRLSACREARGISIKEVMSRFDVSKATAYNWESGAATPDVWTLVALAKWYKVTPNDLLLREGEAGEAKFSSEVAARIEALDKERLAGLERAVVAHLDAVAPLPLDVKQRNA